MKKQCQPKAPKEYREGPEARENFEKAMKGLFRSPKAISKKHPMVQCLQARYPASVLHRWFQRTRLTY